MPICIFDPEYESPHCNCGKRISIGEIRDLIEAEDCLLVRENKISAEEFSTDICIDCPADRILGNPEAGKWDYVQDEEGNYEYPEDLDNQYDL